MKENSLELKGLIKVRFLKNQKIVEDLFYRSIVDKEVSKRG
jgi:RNA-binding protein YhbY